MWGKAIQIQAVKVSGHLLEHVLHLPDAKGQVNKALGQGETVKTWRESPVALNQLLAQGPELLKGLRAAQDVLR